jgi:CRP/FNR family transcriptional regulator, cyclic AMP receptor protein
VTSEIPSIEELLRQAPFLQPLSPGDLARVAQIAGVEQFQPGEVLFQEGSACERVYLVVEGLVALDMCMPRRGCVRILTVGPREIVGVSALLGNERMTTRATAVEATTLISLPARKVRELCESDHDIGYAVMTQLSAALVTRLLATRLQLLDVYGETQTAERSRH